MEFGGVGSGWYEVTGTPMAATTVKWSRSGMATEVRAGEVMVAMMMMMMMMMRKVLKHDNARNDENSWKQYAYDTASQRRPRALPSRRIGTVRPRSR